MRIAVIGTAGRGLDKYKMTSPLYTKMYHRLQDELSDIPVADRDLISGGAPWADYLAVSLFKAGLACWLRIALPCEWDWERHQFKDTGIRDFKQNPGRTLNFYYQHFSDQMGVNTLETLEKVFLMPRCVVGVYNGFFHRNTIVSDCHRMIAFTWEEGAVPKDGGTLDTWEKAPEYTQKIHVELGKLK